jgi:hypothetical protein
MNAIRFYSHAHTPSVSSRGGGAVGEWPGLGGHLVSRSREDVNKWAPVVGRSHLLILKDVFRFSFHCSLLLEPTLHGGRTCRLLQPQLWEEGSRPQPRHAARLGPRCSAGGISEQLTTVKVLPVSSVESEEGWFSFRALQRRNRRPPATPRPPLALRCPSSTYCPRAW